MINTVKKDDWKLKRGDTLATGTRIISVADSPTFDWTGVTLKVQIRYKGVLQKELTPTPDLSVTGKMKYNWTWPASETQLQNINQPLEYDEQYTLGAVVRTVVEGTILFTQDQTYV
jgi:hypothetical protein